MVIGIAITIAMIVMAMFIVTVIVSNIAIPSIVVVFCYCCHFYCHKAMNIGLMVSAILSRIFALLLFSFVLYVALSLTCLLVRFGECNFQRLQIPYTIQESRLKGRIDPCLGGAIP